jgi:hypothetical protein
MVVEGRAFQAGIEVTIELDGLKMRSGIRPDGEGRFVASIPLGNLIPG